MKSETVITLAAFGAVAFGAWYFLGDGKSKVDGFLEKLSGKTGEGGLIGQPVFEATHPFSYKTPSGHGYISPAPVQETVKWNLEELFGNLNKVIAGNQSQLLPNYSSSKITPTPILTSKTPAVNYAPAGVSGVAQSIWNAGAMQQGKTIQLQSTSPAAKVNLTGMAASIWNAGAAQQAIKQTYSNGKTTTTTAPRAIGSIVSASQPFKITR